MSVGILTRESVRRALQVGITAMQIITYLRTNAHPQTLSAGAKHCLPITVSPNCIPACLSLQTNMDAFNRSVNYIYFVPLSGSRPNSSVGRWEKEARLRQCHILFYVREREAVHRSVNQTHRQLSKLELKWILILVNYIHLRKCIAKLCKHVKSHVAYRE